jgi:AraC-like DNA-binding protein
MDLITIIIFLGVVQGILVGILLLTLNRGNTKANHLLGILMILFSISISGFLLQRINIDVKYLFFAENASSVILLFGPLFYFYILALVKRNFQLNKKYLPHFLPFAALAVFDIIFYLSHSQKELQIEYSQAFSVLDRIMIGIQIIHVFIYTIFIKRIIKEHEMKIKSTLSFIENINLKWVNLTANLLQFVFGLIAILIILSSAGINTEEYFNSFIPAVVAIIILGLGYWGFKQPIIFPPEDEKKESRKYEWSGSNDEKADEYLSRLKIIMIRDKPYLESSLTLQKLADMAEISPQNLSQIINVKLNQNFFDFINCYRITEAKKLLIDPRGQLLTILAIAAEAGFNSKSSFNAAFKKMTGMTPTEYKKSLLNLS